MSTATDFFRRMQDSAHRLLGSPQKEHTDSNSLRFTIMVNLDILNEELEELSAVAAQSTANAEVTQASELLRVARDIAYQADIILAARSTETLGQLLEAVFGAMNNATTARKLLNACRPV
jgi:hypothetical protein